MDQLRDYMEKFNVYGIEVEKFTPRQLQEVNENISSFLTKLRIFVFIIGGILVFLAFQSDQVLDEIYLYLLTIEADRWIPFFPSNVDDYYFDRIVVSVFLVFLVYLIVQKFYREIGHHYTLSRLKDTMMENLERKLEEHINPEKPLSPEVEKKLNKELEGLRKLSLNQYATKK